MRILYIAPPLANGGGVAAYTEMLQARLGDDVIVDNLETGARNHTSGAAKEPGVLKAARRLCGDFRHFVRQCRNHDYDVIHFNPSFRAKSVLRDGLNMIWLRLFGPGRALVLFHGWSDRLARTIAATAAGRCLFRQVYGWAPVTIVLSRRFRDQLLAMGFAPDRVFVGSTMFDGRALAQLDQAVMARARQQRAAENRLNVVFMSRVERDKGANALVEAVAGLVAAGRNGLRLSVIGNGRELDDLKRMVASRGLTETITFHGYIASAEEKARLLSEADVFCLASHSEGMPMALLEAMGAGLAIVATRVGGIPEACASSGAILLDNGDPAAIASALDTILAHPGARRAWHERSARRARDCYEAAVVAKTIRGYYSQIAAAAAAATPARPETGLAGR